MNSYWYTVLISSLAAAALKALPVLCFVVNACSSSPDLVVLMAAVAQPWVVTTYPTSVVTVQAVLSSMRLGSVWALLSSL